ncbi:hypothetical protein Ancab_027800 [Ancistrocladus abbreviatus]
MRCVWGHDLQLGSPVREANRLSSFQWQTICFGSTMSPALEKMVKRSMFFKWPRDEPNCSSMKRGAISEFVVTVGSVKRC